MSEVHKTYLPAAGHDWLLPFYDPLTKLIGADSALRELIERADLGANDRVLDLGCGTGNLLALLRRTRADVTVLGLDPDAKALARAKRKVDSQVQLDQGFADELPYPDAHFDRVLSSFMFHHISREQQAAALLEIARVLKPGGSVHVLDFGKLEARDAIPELMTQAGLLHSAEVGHRRTLLGRVAYYAASTRSTKH